jgi:hypothetical protein
MNEQREELPNEILIFIVDESYGRGSEFVESSQFADEIAITFAASRKYREELEEEFGEKFEEYVNVGPGADLPAFVTAISENMVPLLPWLMAVFFTGKPIVDNIEAWRKIFVYIRRYFSRPLLFNRQGAAVIAVESVLEEMNGIPKSIKLINYRGEYRYDEQEPTALSNTVISDAPPTLNLSMLRHVFEIEADGVHFIVTVDGKNARARKT